MALREASDLFVECLEAEGVKHVFGIPGEETLDLNESLSDSSIQFVPVRHEQVAQNDVRPVCFGDQYPFVTVFGMQHMPTLEPKELPQEISYFRLVINYQYGLRLGHDSKCGAT